MGTRSLTVMEEDDGTEIAVLYRQYDGYPDAHGADLAKFLAGFRVGNGIGADAKLGSYANGAAGLAAQIVAHFKTEVGNFYLYPAKTRDCGEEWVYTIRPTKDGLRLTVQAGMVTMFGMPGTKQASMPVLFSGPPRDFDAGAISDAYDQAETPPADALEEVVGD